MNRIDLMREAGLGTAMREAKRKTDPCNFHSTYVDRGWKFCPHCGVRLAIIHNCATCGKKFTSEKAFNYHNFQHLVLPCPMCRSKKHVRRAGGRPGWFVCKECEHSFNKEGVYGGGIRR